MRTCLCLFIWCLMFSCSKNETGVVLPSPGSLHPTYVAVKYYFAPSSLVLQTGYRPLTDSIKDADFAVEITDTVYNYCPNFCIQTYRSIITTKVDPLTGVVSSINSKFVFAKRVGTYTDGTKVITDLQQTFGNFSMNVKARSLGGGSYTSEAIVSQYNDIAQQHVIDTRSFGATTHRLPEQRYYFEVAWGDQGTGTYYWVKPDSIFIWEEKGTSTFFQPSRYADFYKYDIPWYNHKRIDVATYARRSKAACSQFVLQNGDYVGLDFKVGMERSVRYQYGADSAALFTLGKILSPGTDDFFWYYVADFRKNWNNNLQFAEALEPQDFYEWTASGSTDSVYVYSGNTKVFKQAATMQNTVEKDSFGRPVKITHRVSNSSAYKVMEIKY